MNGQLAVAVVGVGHFGKYHAEKLSRLPRAKLVAVADIDPAVAAETGAMLGVEAVTDHRVDLPQGRFSRSRVIL